MQSSSTGFQTIRPTAGLTELDVGEGVQCSLPLLDNVTQPQPLDTGTTSRGMQASIIKILGFTPLR